MQFTISKVVLHVHRKHLLWTDFWLYLAPVYGYYWITKKKVKACWSSGSQNNIFVNGTEI